MADESDVWSEAAERDRAMSSQLLETLFFEGAAFHAQQAAEKILKALLASRNAWSRTHSCTEMLSLLRQDGLEVDDALFRASRLVDRAYVDSRYPRSFEDGGAQGPSELYDLDMAKEVMESCDRLMTWVRSVRSFSGSSSD